MNGSPAAPKAVLTLCDGDRHLLEETARALQSVAALVRGLLATQPRPVPPGDWGRGHEMPAPAAGRAAQSRLAPQREPVSRPVQLVRRGKRRHTPSSIAEDARKIRHWMAVTGLKASQVAKAAGLGPFVTCEVLRGNAGLPENAELKLAAAVAKLAKAASR
jgi:hypothetical protein